MPLAALKNHAGGRGTVFDFLIQNLSLNDLLNDIASGRTQKSRRREWWKTARLFARVVTRAEGTAQRRDFAAIGGVSET